MNISSRKSCITELFFQIPEEFIFHCPPESPCPFLLAQSFYLSEKLKTLEKFKVVLVQFSLSQVLYLYYCHQVLA